LSVDGKYLARTGEDKKVIIWKASQPDTIVFRKPLVERGRSLVFSYDGKLLAVGSDNLYVFETATGEMVDHVLGYRISTVQFSRDSRYLVSSQTNSVVAVYDRSSGNQSTLRSRSNDIPNMALSADDRTILAFDQSKYGGKFLVWDVASGEMYGSMKNLTAVVPEGSQEATMTFATESKLIVCSIGGEQGRIGVWDLALPEDRKSEAPAK